MLFACQVQDTHRIHATKNIVQKIVCSTGIKVRKLNQIIRVRNDVYHVIKKKNNDDRQNSRDLAIIDQKDLLSQDYLASRQ